MRGAQHGASVKSFKSDRNVMFRLLLVVISKIHFSTPCLQDISAMLNTTNPHARAAPGDLSGFCSQFSVTPVTQTVILNVRQRTYVCMLPASLK